MEYKLIFNYLKCVRQQESDLTDGDEIELSLGGIDGVCGIPIHSGSMKTGDTAVFEDKNATFSGSPTLYLIEVDTPELGDGNEQAAWTIEPVAGGFAATFYLGDDGIYVLSYTVLDSCETGEGDAEEGEDESPATDPPAKAGAPPGQILKYITSGADVPVEQRYDEYKAIIESVGKYPFVEAEGTYNLIGLRGLVQPNRTIVDNDASSQWDEWDDTIAVVWMEGGKKCVKEYKASCDPGRDPRLTRDLSNKNERNEYANPKGIAHLYDGQWAYLKGYHGKKAPYPCLKQAEDFDVWRSTYRKEDGWEADNQFDEQDMKKDTGNFGINLHAGGEGKEVDIWSVGCQNIWGGKGAGTFYAEVMGPGTTKTSKHGGNVKKHFDSPNCPELAEATAIAKKGQKVIYYTLVTVVERSGELADALSDEDVGEAAVACPKKEG